MTHSATATQKLAARGLHWNAQLTVASVLAAQAYAQTHSVAAAEVWRQMAVIGHAPHDGAPL